MAPVLRAACVAAVLVLCVPVRAQPAVSLGDQVSSASGAVVPLPPLGFEAQDLNGQDPQGVAQGVSGVWAMMVKTGTALCAVLLLVYLVVGKGLGKLAHRQTQGRAMRVLDRVSLDPKRTLYLVDVDGVKTLVGVGDNTLSMMPLRQHDAPTGGDA